MGYSITAEQADKIDRLAAEGRRCSESTGRGGCFGRATVRQMHVSWPYKVDEAYGSCPVEGQLSAMVFCVRHARTMPVGYEGVNFRVIGSERF